MPTGILLHPPSAHLSALLHISIESILPYWDKVVSGELAVGLGKAFHVSGPTLSHPN